MDNKTILITGAAGFIGSNLIKKLLVDYTSLHIIGVDNINDYYDVELKKYRLNELYVIEKESNSTFEMIIGNISDNEFIHYIFNKFDIDIVVNLAAQAGVRYSILNPDSYMESNVLGFYNILEACKMSYEKAAIKKEYSGVEHLIYASSSSVYGGNNKVPYSVDDKVDLPVSLYAATKKADELFAHVYSKLYNIPSTGLRFFTVYGPAGRPDMAYFSFTNKLVKREKIEIYNYGKCKRDFTYIDDIILGIINVMQKPPRKKVGDDGLPIAPYAIYNIGNSKPESLLDFIDILQKELVSQGVLPLDYDFELYKIFVPMQPGDVEVTYADTSDFERDFGFKPSTPLHIGLKKFVQWYKEYYLK